MYISKHHVHIKLVSIVTDDNVSAYFKKYTFHVFFHISKNELVYQMGVIYY